jgi:HK97 family phage prohead protease/HK97 family phage major capsid protein
MAEDEAMEWASLNDRQKKQAEDTAEIALEYGMFDQTDGANGSHYAPADANPFKEQGLICGNCIFFDEATSRCQVVSGEIEAEAICKLWIIPENVLQARSELMELETRTAEFRLDNAEERTITGLAVPYGQDANIGGAYNERFAPGAIADVTDVKLFYGHETPIGVVTSGRETDHGYEITAKVSDTSLGNDVLTLMRDGALNKFSVGFVPVEQTRDGNTITRTKVALKEVSVVPFPAYAGASITEVREESASELPNNNESESELENNIELDVAQVKDEVAEVRRMVESVALAPKAPVATEIKFRSQGEFAQALVKGDAEAAELLRTYSAGTSADTYNLPGWVGFINNLINLNRPTWNAFSKGVLPAAGLTVDYAEVTTNGATVADQGGENAAIAQGNIVIGHKSADVKTYAGQTVLSRQLVERSTVPFLDTAFQAMSIAYANTTNAAVVSALAGLTWTGKVMDMDGGTAKSVLEGITDGAKYIKTNSGLNPEFILAGPALYKYLVTLADQSGRPVVSINGDGQNSIGSAPAPLQATIWGLPIIVDTTLGDTVGYMANSQALKLYESAGAPVRLVDDISGQANLQNAYSVYGYAAITVPFESAIVKLDFTA